jgi:hypothetical protein
MEKLQDSYFYNAEYNILGVYTYFIWANDSSGNANISESHTFLIVDTTPPEIIDNSPSFGTTGDSYTFNATVTDNVEVEWVQVKYWYENSDPIIKEMPNIMGSNYYEYSFIIDHWLDDLYYEISAKDTSGRWSNTSITVITIIDNDVPEIQDNTNTICYTGNQFTFNTFVIDNIQVANVYVEYWYSSGSHTNLSMANVGGNVFEKSVTIDDISGELHYFISAKDTSDNWNETDVKDVSVIDDDSPSIFNLDASPNPQEINGYVNITSEANDNIEVDTVKVDITGPPGFTHIKR